MARSRQIFGTVLFCLVLMSTIGHLAFMHSHKLASGTVTHSHPYLPFGDEGTSHSHSSGEFDFIQYVNSSFGSVVLAEIVHVPVSYHRTVSLTFFSDESCYCADSIISSLRAPPHMA